MRQRVRRPCFPRGKARRAGVAKHNYGVPEKSDSLFGERRSSGVIESLLKPFFEGAGAKDMKLVTTRRVWRNIITGSPKSPTDFWGRGGAAE